MAKKVKQPKLYELREGAEARIVEGTIRNTETNKQEVVRTVMVKRNDGLWQNAFWRSPEGAESQYAFVEHVPQASQNSNG